VDSRGRSQRASGVAVVGELPQAAPAHSDGAELRGDVDGVDENQRRGDEDGHQDHVCG
jgi:hypothetical protein